MADYIRNCEYDRDYFRSRKTSVVINRVPVEGFTEVATLTEAKAQLRIDHSHEDTLIGELIVTARQEMETYTGRSLVETIVTVVIENAQGNYMLPYGPFIDTFTLVDDDEVAVATGNYEIVAEGSHVFLDFYGYGRHTMSYKAGFEEVPASLKRAVLFYLEYLYDPSELGEKSKKKAESLAKSFRTQTMIY